jgi:hypothetical protein
MPLPEILRTILQVHVYDPPANTDPVILAQQSHGRPIDSPDSSKKLPVAFVFVCFCCQQWREKMPIPAQATCSRQRGVTAGRRRLAVTVWSYRGTARLLDTAVVDESARMNSCRSVSSAVRPRMCGSMRCFQCWSLLVYWCRCSATLTCLQAPVHKYCLGA